MRPFDAKIDHIDQRPLRLALREDAQRIARHGAVMAGQADGVVKRPVFFQQARGMFEIALPLVELGQRAVPKGAFGVVAAPEGQNNRQGDFAFTKIVADGFAERRLLG